MTQKELLYLEDAVEHEKNIIKICEVSAAKIEDEELISFMQNEIVKHKSMQEKLIDMLEVKANE